MGYVPGALFMSSANGEADAVVLACARRWGPFGLVERDVCPYWVSPAWGGLNDEAEIPAHARWRERAGIRRSSASAKPMVLSAVR